MGELLVSVIIPVYNVKEYLIECVESVLEQSYQNLEILLIDDGSFDGSSEICDVYMSIDNRIKVIHQENVGLSATRNLGIAYATGKFVYFLDSDDFICYDTIEVCVSKICETESDFIFFDAISFVGTPSGIYYSDKKSMPVKEITELYRARICIVNYC